MADWPLSWSVWGPRTPILHSINNRWDSPTWSSRTMTWTPSDRAWPHLRCQEITCTPTVNASNGNQMFNLLVYVHVFFNSFIFFLHYTIVFFFLGFKGLYPETDPLCHLTDSDGLPLGDSSLLTPIDRLYSMQDSYFTSWEWVLGWWVLFTLHLLISFPSFHAPFRKSEPGRCGSTVTTCNKLYAPLHTIHIIIQGAMYALSNLTSDVNSGM